jgi:hypothetical protein
MPKKCDYCDFFHPENHLNECPDCGRTLRFTMFAPPGFQTGEAGQADGEEPWDESKAPYEELELSVSVRMSQIGVGIGAYFLISRTAMGLFCGLLFFGNKEMKLEEALISYLLARMVFEVAGALAGGAVAGAWSVNWVPQGIGVGLGVFVLPFVLLLVFPPEQKMAFIIFFAVVSFTTAVAVFGAFVGHKLVRPFRYVIS